jgi:hypothetical protein
MFGFKGHDFYMSPASLPTKEIIEKNREQGVSLGEISM